SGRRAGGSLRAARRRVKISILAFDLADNATGRADLLARLLAPLGEVEVVGPRFGEAIWRPALGGPVAYRALAVGDAARWPRFAGTLVPHVRDTEAWDPARYERAAARAALGLGGERVVMFLGTPRGHKGVDDLVEAVGAVGGDTRLLLVGADTRSEAARRWAA